MTSQKLRAPHAGLSNAQSGGSWRNVALLVFVVLAWGLNWVVMKIVVQEVTPLWAVAMRTILAVIVLAPILLLTGQFIIPTRSDIPVVLAIALFHMVAFAALMAIGLKYVSAGRTIVLGYTTPLWVAPGAWLFLSEPIRPRQIIGIVLGLSGLLLMFDPNAFDWRDAKALLGNGLILCAAIFWSISILYTRAHQWTATPFQLVLWQTVLAGALLSALAFTFEGTPEISLSASALLALAYNGVVGTALGYWAMTVVNKELPAISTSLGVLGTPVVGIGLSALILGEAVDPKLMASALMILVGIAVGTRLPLPSWLSSALAASLHRITARSNGSHTK
ncbi:DMT family transporter [Bradyrhizobium icense]|uniref:Transporter n=1 Tax=Bradyrhizobium icense TaxID=1274631 RepID=A0A1B1URK7_9BRAD|nr:DMT family transporter [Bradyrhizobium icense]ANW05385.1 transporter [Bradyrhizobium icense]